MNAEDILGAILLFAFASMGFGLAALIWVFVWDCFETTDIGSAFSNKIADYIESKRKE